MVYRKIKIRYMVNAKIGSLLGIKYTLIFKILVFWCEFEGKFFSIMSFSFQL